MSSLARLRATTDARPQLDAAAGATRRPTLRRHLAGVAMALLMAAMLVGPRWWLLATDPAQGARVEVNPWGHFHQGEDEAQYEIVTRRAFDGDIPVRDPYLSTDAGAPAQPTQLWQQAVGQLARPIGGVFVSLALLATISAAMGLLLLYVFVVDAGGSEWIGVALLPITALSVQLFNQSDGVIALLHGHALTVAVTARPEREFYVLGRYTAPVMLLPFFFGSVIATPKAVDSGRARWIVAAAICAAVLVYSYLFYWTVLGLALTAWFGWLLLRRDFVRARRLAAVGALALVLSLPELASTAHKAITVSHDVRLRAGLEDSIGIDRVEVRYALERLAIGIPLFWAMRRDAPRGVFYAALFVFPLLLGVTQGIVPQSWHYSSWVWSVFAIPAVIAGGIALVRESRGRIPRYASRWAPAAFALLAVLALLHMGVMQARALREVDASFAVPDDEHAAFAWIDEHAGRETVVSPSITTNELLASLTSARVYVAGGFLSDVSDEELVDRYLRASAAFAYDEQTTFDRIDPARGGADHLPPYEQRFELFAGYYLLHWQVVSTPERVAARIPAWREKFRAMQQEAGVLSAHPAAYLYCGHRERLWPATQPPQNLMVTVAFQQGEATVYRISDASDPAAAPFTGCG